ncbi:MAG TPA: polysaccharide pyruvyl transferase family protein, partial [Clostridia bacterium]|nr:polysaccharide pyruvyl transferase family protein [Clostridia bacterium]
DREALTLLEGSKGIKNYFMADDIVYNLPADLLRNPKERTGLGISCYRSIRPGEINYQNYQALAALADRYVQETGKKVFLFSFDSEGENDLAAAHHILNLSREKDMIEIIPYLGDDAYFLDRFSRCERLIAIRFHSAILADICQIPFLPVAYSNKMFNLMEDRGFQGLSLKLSELTLALDLDMLTQAIIDGGQLFDRFIGDQHTAALHFNQLEALLEGS